MTGSFAYADEASPGSDTGRDLNISVDLGTGIMRGHTTYQIGGEVKYADGRGGDLRFPISELKFPLDVNMASLSVSAEFKKRWGLALNLRKNITSDAGKMEDSDWGYWHDGAELPHAPGSTCSQDKCSDDSLDIYSESDAELDALIIDLDFRYRFFNKTFIKTRLSFFTGAGFIHKEFRYDISDLDQWYPSYQQYFGVDLGHDRVSGKVLTYDISYYIPYIRAGTTFDIIDRFGIQGSLAVSPYLVIHDEDNHILRDKTSEGELEGAAIMLSLEGRYNFTRHWFTKFEIDYMNLYAEGEQKQYLSGAYFATIDQEIRSEQLTAMLKAGYTF